MKALVFNEFGNSDVLQYVDIPDAVAGKGEILLDTTAIGLNFADIYRRKGNYHLVGEPPYVLGYEGAGVVVALGEGVTDFAIGDRVAFLSMCHLRMRNVWWCLLRRRFRFRTRFGMMSRLRFCCKA
ncbi:Quinone oxidoreductase 1 [Listeria newyorkensis]|nr:Quinone oxidoreductase 1 [Listeria newyorkensis]